MLASYLVAFLALIFTALPAWAQLPPKRVALVVGNDAYQGLTKLKNPGLDAARLADILAANGFEVLSCDGQRPGCFDLTRAAFLQALDLLRTKSAGAELAFVFYAGHGMEVSDGNILAPINMQLDCTDKESRNGILLRDIFPALSGARQRIVVIDACRDNPFTACPTRSAQKRSFGTLTVPDVDSFLLMSSTKPGQVASDGLPGEHSPFAKALFHWLQKAPELHFHQLLQLHVAKTVMEATTVSNQTQIPETRVQGVAPEACLKGLDCVADVAAGALAIEVEHLKQQMARNQDVTAAGLGVLEAAERRKGVPLTGEERKNLLERLTVAARDLVEDNTAASEAALQSMAAGDSAAAEERFSALLAQEERAAKSMADRAAEKRRNAARAASNIAALAMPTNKGKAAQYYKRASELDPEDPYHLLDYANAARLSSSSAAAKDAFLAILKGPSTHAQRKKDESLGILRGPIGFVAQRHFDARIGVGDIAKSEGQLGEALQNYEAALQLAAAETSIATLPPSAKSRAKQNNDPITDSLVYLDAIDKRGHWVAWHRNLSFAHDRLGLVLSALRKFDTAFVHLRTALSLMEDLSKAEPEVKYHVQNVSVAHSRIGNLLASRRDYQGALTAYRAAHAIDLRLTESDPQNASYQQNLAVSHSQIADMLLNQGDVEGALKDYRALFAIAERQARLDPTNTSYQTNLAAAYSAIGGVLISQKEFRKAADSIRPAVKIYQILADNEPNNAEWRSALVHTSMTLGDSFRQIPDLDAALESYRLSSAAAAALTKIDPSRLAWQVQLGDALLRVSAVLDLQRKHADALASARDYLKTAETMLKLAPDEPDGYQAACFAQTLTADAFVDLGDTAAALGRRRTAVSFCENAASRLEAAGKNAGPALDQAVAMISQQLAWNALNLRQFSKALLAAQRAHALQPTDALIDGMRAHALLFGKRTAEAKALYAAHKGGTVEGMRWVEWMAIDFRRLRLAKLTHQLLPAIETELGVAPPYPQSASARNRPGQSGAGPAKQ